MLICLLRTEHLSQDCFKLESVLSVCFNALLVCPLQEILYTTLTLSEVSIKYELFHMPVTTMHVIIIIIHNVSGLQEY